MSQEIETRAIISENEIDTILNLISKIGFLKIDEYSQTDIILDNKEASLFKNEQKIRVRVENNKAELTYKGKFEGDSKFISKRKEINIPLQTASVEDVILFFQHIGCPILFQIKKMRSIYHFNGIHINIDKWPIIGYLMEIEGEKELITQISDKLQPTIILKNFRLKDMFELKCKESGLTFQELKTDYETKNNFNLGNIELIF